MRLALLRAFENQILKSTMLCFCWLLVTTLAAGATWSLATPDQPCVGTAIPDPVAGYVLICTPTDDCVSGLCNEIPLPGSGSSVQTYCSCSFPEGTPDCCFVMLKKLPNGKFDPAPGGTCPFGSNCGWGRCGLVVGKTMAGETIVVSECLAFL